MTLWSYKKLFDPYTRRLVLVVVVWSVHTTSFKKLQPTPPLILSFFLSSRSSRSWSLVVESSRLSHLSVYDGRVVSLLLLLIEVVLYPSLSLSSVSLSLSDDESRAKSVECLSLHKRRARCTLLFTFQKVSTIYVIGWGRAHSVYSSTWKTS